MRYQGGRHEKQQRIGMYGVDETLVSPCHVLAPSVDDHIPVVTVLILIISLVRRRRRISYLLSNRDSMAKLVKYVKSKSHSYHSTKLEVGISRLC